MYCIGQEFGERKFGKFGEFYQIYLPAIQLLYQLQYFDVFATLFYILPNFCYIARIVQTHTQKQIQQNTNTTKEESAKTKNYKKYSKIKYEQKTHIKA